MEKISIHGTAIISQYTLELKNVILERRRKFQDNTDNSKFYRTAKDILGFTWSNLANLFILKKILY